MPRYPPPRRGVRSAENFLVPGCHGRRSRWLALAKVHRSPLFMGRSGAACVNVGEARGCVPEVPVTLRALMANREGCQRLCSLVDQPLTDG